MLRHGTRRHKPTVPVPASLRLAVRRIYGTRHRTAVGLHVSEATADALMQPGGVVSAEVLERVSKAVCGG